MNILDMVNLRDMKVMTTETAINLRWLTAAMVRSELKQVTEKWTPKYPNSMKRWKDNWDVISPIFKFSSVVRKVIYTTNAIESLNSTYCYKRLSFEKYSKVLRNSHVI